MRELILACNPLLVQKYYKVAKPLFPLFPVYTMADSLCPAPGGVTRGKQVIYSRTSTF